MNDYGARMTTTKTTRATLSIFALLLGTACGGVGPTDSSMSDARRIADASTGSVAGDASSALGDASFSGPHCDGNRVLSETGELLATCAGLYSECETCAELGGAVCVAPVDVCSGVIVGSDSRAVAFTSRGCNMVTCEARFLRGDLHARVVVNGTTWSIATEGDLLIVTTETAEGTLQGQFPRAHALTINSTAQLRDPFTVDVSGMFIAGTHSYPTSFHLDGIVTE